MIVTKSLEDSIKDFEKKMRMEEQKQEDSKVFVDYNDPRIKTVESLYGDFTSRGKVQNKSVYKTDNRIAHFGFNTLAGFDDAITNLKRELREYDKILKDYQSEIFSINAQIDVIKKHPEDDFTNRLEGLFNRKEEIRESVSLVKDKIKKEEKNLQELIFARKEFMLNKRQTLKNEAKDRTKLLNEYGQKQEEVKELEKKIYMGTANNFDRERLDELKNSIIPDLEKLINRKPLDSNEEPKKDEEQNKDDGPQNDEPQKEESEKEEPQKEEPQKEEPKKEDPQKEKEPNLDPEPPKKIGKVTQAKEGLKKILGKRSTKIILALAGLAGVTMLAAHLLKQGDTSGLEMAQEATKNVAHAASNPNLDILSGTDAGQVTQIFDSNDLASQGINAEMPHPEYFQNDVLGYVTPDNQKVPIDSLQDIITAKDNGVDISSVYYGDSNGIDGYGTQIQGMELDNFTDAYSTKLR